MIFFRFAVYVLFLDRAFHFSPLKTKKSSKRKNGKYFLFTLLFYFYAFSQETYICDLGTDFCLERTKFKVRKSIFSFSQSQESDQIKSDLPLLNRCQHFEEGQLRK